MYDNINDELDMNELELIVGGKPKITASKKARQFMRVSCQKCGEICMVDISEDSYVCHKCKQINYIVG